MPDIPALTLVDAWMIILGVFAPFLAAIVNQPGWSKERRQAIAIAVCGVLAVVYSVAAGHVDLGLGSRVTDVLVRGIVALAVIITVAQGIYRALTPAFTALQGEPARSISD